MYNTSVSQFCDVLVIFGIFFFGLFFIFCWIYSLQTPINMVFDILQFLDNVAFIILMFWKYIFLLLYMIFA